MQTITVTKVWLDNPYRERKFYPALVRSACDYLRGNKVSDNAWANWRRWIDISPNTRTYTFDQLCLLTAIADIRRQQRNDRQRLKESEVFSKAESIEWQKRVASVIKRFDDSSYVMGNEVVDKLALRGIRVSMRDLRRLVSGFSVYKIYTVDDILEYLEI